jgi:nucleoside permease NupC
LSSRSITDADRDGGRKLARLRRGFAHGIVFLGNIIATLVVAIALVSLVNAALGLFPDIAGSPVTLQRLFAYAFGMGAMVPDRRAEIVALGLRSVLSGTLATCMSVAVIGML